MGLILTFVRLVLLVTVYAYFTGVAHGQGKNPSDTAKHILTLFAVHSLRPLDWESPSALVRSTSSSYKAKLLHHRQYILGHILVRIESPLVGGTLYSAMVSQSMKEKRVLLMKEKIGLGILGIAMAGKIQSEKDIRKDLRLFTRLGKIAYVKYYIGEVSARRVIEFIAAFSRSEEGDPSPSHFYGGAFWPRYQEEGSGCSAYGMSVLDVAGVTGREHDEWRKVLHIPMSLIGGDLNGGSKVSLKRIARSPSWADSLWHAGDYVTLLLYDPTLVYDWIHRWRSLSLEGYEKEEEGQIPGLVADRERFKPDLGEPIFLQRMEPSLFIDHFKRTRRVKTADEGR